MNILNLPDDILIFICSLQPKLGLTCKKLNILCPIKPKECTYDKINEYYVAKSILCQKNNILFWYYEFNANIFTDLLKSTKFKLLNITVQSDITELSTYIKYIIENDVNFTKFTFQNELKCAINNQKNGGFIHMEKYNSIIMSMLMYMYH
jgi:hypothetical protein